jgi:phage tail-like protein
MPTCITAFVGATQSGPSDRPQYVQSFSEFESIFGGPWPNGFLPYAVQQYFENGGRDAIICRVEAPSGQLTENDIIDPALETQRRGLWLLDQVKHFDLLCIPPFSQVMDVGRETWEAALTYAESRGAMLLVDPPAAWVTGDQLSDLEQGLASLVRRSPNGAIYFPRLVSANPQQPQIFAPSGAVAGVIARLVHEGAPWHSPAGSLAVLHGFSGPTQTLANREAADLVALGVNPIRVLPAGLTIWGARTLAGITGGSTDFAYIAVRRMALFIERTLSSGLDWASSEPNDEPTWARIRTCAANFLYDLFRQGAFQGTSPQEAFFVQCGSETISQQDIKSGVINIVVGFAPLKPAEFVIIRIRQTNKREALHATILPKPSGEFRPVTLEVEWDGQTISGIISVSGLNQVTEVTEFIEAGETAVRKIPGRTRYGPVVVTGLSPHRAFAEWAHMVATAAPDNQPFYRKDVLIRRINRRGQTTAYWTLRSAWISRHEGPTLSTYNNELRFERITLETDRIEMSYT